MLSFSKLLCLENSSLPETFSLKSNAKRRLFGAIANASIYCAIISVFSLALFAQQGNFSGNIDRPLRYYPENGDFAIKNGKEFFNRPLYGGNTAFRVDAGDKPEFLLYLPGRGGNLRFAVRTDKGEKWLFDADEVITRYRPGSMIYEIRDSLLGGGILKLTVLTTYKDESLLIHAELEKTIAPVELIWVYGGANGARGRRNGDIGTESVPISEFFQFKPEFAKDNKFQRIGSDKFTLESKVARILGTMPKDSHLFTADAARNNLKELLVNDNKEPENPVIVGWKKISPSAPLFLALTLDRLFASNSAAVNESQQKAEDTTPENSVKYLPEDLPHVFEETEKYRRSIAGKVIVETPDNYINTSVAALNIASDSVWDEQQTAYMHGAVAWRNKLLGWRGAYTGDALGWHDRTRRHLEYWATRQNTSPISNAPLTQDASVNFARNEPELHSNGDISNSHYDMNIVYIDALYRHILWTGDVEFARKMFPVIKRHLAWEQRLFRREFGPEKLPLYEAYVCIWASDDLQYHGGGVTHSTAYNFYHNKMAARIAKMLGEDAAPYEREAELIQKAMRRNLWLRNRGWYGEFKDLLGLQKVHESAALWTFYHTVDSEAVTPLEAWQMTRFVDTQIPHFPIRGTNVPRGNYYTLATTNWMPYTWSTNNVVTAEAMHTSLGFWQAGRREEAFKLYKGAILDGMYSGICPGNVGMTTYFDVYRRESQRDFADGIGTDSRALIEGLFGIKPDSLSRELAITPGFPADWNYARLKHTDIDFSFKREGLKETFVIEQRFPKTLTPSLRIYALRDQIEKVLVNGKTAGWKADETAVGQPRLIIQGQSLLKNEITIIWKGRKIETVKALKVIAENGNLNVKFNTSELLEINDPQNALRNLKQSSNSLSAIAAGNLGNRTVFVKVRQGRFTWQLPLMFEIRPAFEILPIESRNAEAIRFKVRNNTPKSFNKPVDLMINGQPQSAALKLPAFGESGEFVADSKSTMPGSNSIKINFGDGAIASGTVINWHIKTNNSAKFEAVNLKSVFNDQVTNIFKNQYLSPRSPYVSLAIPKQGIGSWAHWDEKFDVDDSGLRKIAAQNEGKILLPNGVPLDTPGTLNNEKNIAFTSQWDNFPREISVTLNGRATHAYLLMAGSTNQMQSRFKNGEIIVRYADNSVEQLALENPVNWWAIDQDYLIDDFAFKLHEALPPRVDLKTGEIRMLDLSSFKGKGGKVTGGAATVLDLPLDKSKELKSLTVKTIANEVVIGLLSLTLARN